MTSSHETSHDRRLAAFTLHMTAMMAAGTVLPFVLAAVAPVLVRDLGLDRTRFGALTTVLFAVAAVLSPAMGWVVDRVPTRRAYAGYFALSAVALAGIGVAGRYWLLLLFTAASGIAHALANPLSNRLVAEHVPRRRQGAVVGVKQSGVQVGMVLAGLALPLLAVALGWRGGVAVAALAVALAGLATVRRIPDHPARRRAGGAGGGRLARPVLVVAAYSSLLGSAMASLTAYLPLYAHETLALPAPVAGALVGTAGTVGVLTRVAIGRLSDRIDDPVRLLVAPPALATGAVALLLAAPAIGSALLWAGALLFGGSMAWNAVSMITLLRVTPAGDVGRAAGAVMGGFYSGFIVAPVTVGAVVDATGSYTIAWVGLLAVLAFATVTLWLWRRRGASGWSPVARPVR